MLCQFSFKNFKSYKETTTFDFQATSIPEFSESLLKSEKADALLPVGVIYGPNGGGKTNLLLALSCLISTVVKPIYELEKAREKIIIQQKISAAPFYFNEISRKMPTEFEVYFRQGKNEYRYNLSICGDDIVEESLYWKSIGGKRTGMVFDREGAEITLGASINKASINRSVNPKMPYLSFLAINYDIPVIVEVQKWFESCIVKNYANPIADRQIMFSDDESYRKRIVRALTDVDIDVSGYRYDEENHEYLKNFKDSPHMDGISKEQLKFENVIVLETEIKPYPGDEVIKYVDWEGGENAKGYYISEGKMVPITWSKAGMYDPLKFFDANGNELQLNRGKSYIAFTYAGNCKVEG